MLNSLLFAAALSLTEGQLIPISGPTVICDTPEQLATIIEARRSSVEDSRAQLMTLNKTFNDHGEPACFVMQNVIRLWIGKTVAEHVDVPVGLENVSTTYYVVEISNEARTRSGVMITTSPSVAE